MADKKQDFYYEAGYGFVLKIPVEGTFNIEDAKSKIPVDAGTELISVRQLVGLTKRYFLVAGTDIRVVFDDLNDFLKAGGNLVDWHDWGVQARCQSAAKKPVGFVEQFAADLSRNHRLTDNYSMYVDHNGAKGLR